MLRKGIKKAKRQHKLPKSLRDHDDDNNKKLAKVKQQIQKVVREKRCLLEGAENQGVVLGRPDEPFSMLRNVQNK